MCSDTSSMNTVHVTTVVVYLMVVRISYVDAILYSIVSHSKGMLQLGINTFAIHISISKQILQKGKGRVKMQQHARYKHASAHQSS